MRNINKIIDYLEKRVFVISLKEAEVLGINNFCDLTKEEENYLYSVICECFNCGDWNRLENMYEGDICEDCEFDYEDRTIF